MVRAHLPIYLTSYAYPNSIVRSTLFPDVKADAKTTNCAYRAIIPYDRIRQDPITKEIIQKQTMEVWMGHNAYIVTYPISGGEIFNLVLSHHRPEKVYATQPDVPIEELRNEYKDFDPRIKRTVDMIPETARMPSRIVDLLLMLFSMTVSLAPVSDRTPAPTQWSTIWRKALLRLWKTEHSLQVHRGRYSRKAQSLRSHQPLRSRAYAESVSETAGSFLNGAIWHLPDGPKQQTRDAVMEPELEGKYLVRSSNLYCDSQTVLDAYVMMRKVHAEETLAQFVSGRRITYPGTGIAPSLEDKYMGWFTKLPVNKPHVRL